MLILFDFSSFWVWKYTTFYPQKITVFLGTTKVGPICPTFIGGSHTNLIGPLFQTISWGGPLAIAKPLLNIRLMHADVIFVKYFYTKPCSVRPLITPRCYIHPQMVDCTSMYFNLRWSKDYKISIRSHLSFKEFSNTSIPKHFNAWIYISI